MDTKNKIKDPKPQTQTKKVWEETISLVRNIGNKKEPEYFVENAKFSVSFLGCSLQGIMRYAANKLAEDAITRSYRMKKPAKGAKLVKSHDIDHDGKITEAGKKTLERLNLAKVNGVSFLAKEYLGEGKISFHDLLLDPDCDSTALALAFKDLEDVKKFEFLTKGTDVQKLRFFTLVAGNDNEGLGALLKDIEG